MLLVVDVETTGLPRRRAVTYHDLSHWPRLVSIAWLFFDTAGTRVAEHYTIVQPDGFQIPHPAVAIHGISTKLAQSAGRPLSDVLSEFAATISAHQPSLLISHNILFDRSVILAEFLRSHLHHHIPIIENLPTYCTMLNGVSVCSIPRLRGGYKFPSLTELCAAILDESYYGNHHALEDVRACARCYFGLRALNPTKISAPIQEDFGLFD